MNVLITGGSGFIGQRLTKQLIKAGHQVTIVDRNRPTQVPDETRYVNLDLVAQDVPDDLLPGHEAVIHLMGVGLFGTWTRKHKNDIYASRIVSGRKVVQAIRDLLPSQRPQVVVSASAVGYYGDTKGQEVDETAPAGRDFLAKVCQDWEDLLKPLDELSVRRVSIRTGIVIGPGGLVGTLTAMFRRHIGAVLGNGRQLISWISLVDVLNIYQAAIENEKWRGPINAVTTKPVSFKEIVEDIAAELKKPLRWKIPSLVLKVYSRDLAASVLESQKVLPTALTKLGYQYKVSDFKEALHDALGLEAEGPGS